MKANELRIGNLVKAFYANTKVKEIYKESVMLEFTTGKLATYPIEGIDGISGIPLTEEWLVKLGLNKTTLYSYSSKSYYLPDDRFKVTLDRDHSGSDHWVSFEGNSMVCFSFVHELQNICYILCGEELEVSK